MCGIFGIITTNEKVLGSLLTEAGKRLSYRGYDSVGCATISNKGEVDLRKDVGKINEVSQSLNFAQMRGNKGLIQLRWATFGAPSKINAQPHFDCNKDMIGAHNGNVVNTAQLREQFLKEGHKIRSTNDGEICVHAVEKYFDKGDSMLVSIRKAYKDLKGDYAFIIFNNKEHTLYAIKKGSGLVIGLGKEEMYCSSDLPSILPLTNKIIHPEDGEIIILKPNSVKLVSVETGKEVQRKVKVHKEEMEAAQKAGYEHFMLKEIHEQPTVARNLLDLLNESKYVNKFIDILKNSEKVFFVGCGSSYHACILGSFFFNKIAKKSAIPVIAPQFIEQYGNSIDDNTAVVFVSQSGETKDVLNALNFVKKKNSKILGILNVLGSTLMRKSTVYLPLACGYEVSVPATKTFTNQAILFLYLAKRYAKQSCKDLEKLPILLEKTLKSTEKHCKTVSKQLSVWKDLYYLGYGVTYGSAMEGALKLKEITYLHCEGIYSSEFKHGPLSAVEKNYPVLFVVAPGDVDMIINHINEVTCRHGKAIAVAQYSTQLEKNVNTYITLPISDKHIASLLAVIPLQLIAYFASVSKGINPDFPRNLSKTLTVD